MRSLRRWILLAFVLFLFIVPQPLRADCPDNPLLNPGFEDGFRKTEDLGTSGSSHVANNWYPWALLGGERFNREPEFKVLKKSDIADGFYRIYAGEYSQQFFSTHSTHTAGFYQRVPATPGERVTFSIRVQIYTGQRDIYVDDHPLSDVEQPRTEATRAAGLGPGDYRVYVGIDPYGDEPDFFGDAPPDTVVWSDPILDAETRDTDEDGREIDAWVELSVSTIAKADHIVVYAKGAPEYPTYHNDSFWDEACLISEAGPTATPSATNTLVPSSTPRPSATPTPTSSPTLTRILFTATDTPRPSPTEPIFTPTPTTIASLGITTSPTFTPVPTLTLAPSRTLLAPPEATEGEVKSGGLPALYIVNVLVVALILIWLWRAPRD